MKNILGVVVSPMRKFPILKLKPVDLLLFQGHVDLRQEVVYLLLQLDCSKFQ